MFLVAISFKRASLVRGIVSSLDERIYMETVEIWNARTDVRQAQLANDGTGGALA